MMDKAELLNHLAKAKERADKARLDVVVLTQAAATAQVADACTTHIRLKDAENAEQKHLKEIDWLLDQLDKMDQ